MKAKKPDAADRIYAAVMAAKQAAAAASPPAPFTAASVVTAIREQLYTEGFLKHRINGRDLHFDALATACGFVSPVTKAAAGQIVKTLKEVREVEPAVTPDKLAFVARNVLRKYDKAGPRAVSAHWHEFSGAAEKRTAIARRDPYLEPPNWQATLRHIAKARGWDVADALVLPWCEVSLTLREEIVKVNNSERENNE